ncbi:ribonuclease T2-like [Puccinia graminis f. sp. tritici]|uniref:Ribonuclease T2-like n=1 Tax=Puccinia graminis f. sp. tritici TaxID=56615 RepID=A0A5B0QHN4_PUCGR|nr:ribonuclease T2-like [Puccinia graminis f. sp. tritici]
MVSSAILLLPAILIAINTHSFSVNTQQLIFTNNNQLNTQDYTCPANPPTSCHLSSGDGKEPVNSCCTNTPGGQILLTQFWDSHPATGPSDSWTIHGLWPDNCDGTYEASCDSGRQYHNITQILEQGGGQEALSVMKEFWKDQHGNDETFWEHEWAKHGTCISTLEPHCMGSSYKPQSEVVTFFNRTVDLFKSLPTYEWLKAANIVPSATTTYNLDQLQEVAKQYTGQEAVWNCRGHVLNEVWWHFNTVGTVADGKFVHASPVGPRSTCPYKGIQYLPKGHSGGGGGGGGDHRPKHPGHQPGNPPSDRKHFIYVVDEHGQRNGCLISNGNWLSRATCASFSVSVGHDDKALLEIRTRRGACAFEDSGFRCAKGLKSEGFEKNGDRLVYEGQEVFYSDKLPEGTTQVPILKSKSKNSIYLEIADAH